MQRYKLFAARDGEIIEETIRAPDDEEAQIIAAHRIIDGFGLDFLDQTDFDSVIAETDGATLDVDADYDVPSVVSAWARAQLSFVVDVQNRCDRKVTTQLKDCSSALIRLIQSIDEAYPSIP